MNLTINQRLLVTLNILLLIVAVLLYQLVTESPAEAATLKTKTVTIDYLGYEPNPSGYMKTVCGPGKVTNRSPFKIYEDKFDIMTSRTTEEQLLQYDNWQTVYACKLTLKVIK